MPSQSMERKAGRSAFGGDAAGYHAGRIGYPEALYDTIFARCTALPRVLEIGAGTGHATRDLLARGASSLTAIEADAGQVEYLRTHLPDPRLHCVVGAFPEAAVAGPFDLIAAAACFHWMEPQPALMAARRLLVPGGIWAMWWHSYRNPGMGDALGDAVMPLIADLPMPPSQSLERHYAFESKLHEATLHQAGFGDVEHQFYRHERTIDATQACALYASFSYIRLLPETRRTALLQEIKHIVEHEFGGRVPNVVLTGLYTAVAPL